MNINRITINGQEYNSPDEMPPDVRRLYDNAMQAMGNALPGGQAGNTSVFTTRGGLLNTNIVVRKNITVNDKNYKSLDEMPPELRRLVSTSPTTPTQAYVPIGSGPNVGINARRFLRGVIFWVGVGLAFWIYLGFRK